MISFVHSALVEARKFTVIFTAIILAVGASACSNSQESKDTGATVLVPSAGLDLAAEAETAAAAVEAEAAEAIAKDLATVLQEHKLFRYPDLTYLIAVKDAQISAAKIRQVGGSIVYDPNRGNGSDIPFLVATLPPDKVVDAEFVQDLGVLAMSVDHPSVRRITPNASNLPPFGDNPNHFIPYKEVGVEALRSVRTGQGLGEDTIVAVIDTGVDASHPVFENRVIYWADQTQETRTAITPVERAGASVQVNGKAWTVPAAIAGAADLYLAEISEAAMAAQVNDSERVQGLEGLDFNRNGELTDVFAALIGFDGSKWRVYVDTNADGELSAAEAAVGIVDFNESRAKAGSATTDSDLLRFPGRASGIAYPVLLTFDSEKPSTLQIGVDFGSHGTHVAGSIAANGTHIKGAAPKAKIMAQKVCSGITCTESAILRALVDTFYNPAGLVPDVVNISLGSHEQYRQDVFNLLMRDLAAKFGTVFFISASNSGPGYRTINSIGSFGPVVQVGAHVSKETMEKHYNLQPGTEVPAHNLLFFSSAGPSYTGQLRPNIVAPGSSQSSTPIIDNLSDMYNGTSMSSPLAAGATAAMISLLKQDSEYEFYKELKLAKRAEVASGAENTLGSLSFFPLAVRASLESTALRMDHLTIAQQGHGLIDVKKAYYDLKTKLSGMRTEEDRKGRYFDISLNGSAKGSRLYRRDLEVQGVREITLDLESDGEERIADREEIRNSATNVKLVQVEVQAPNGEIVRTAVNNESDLTKVPFAIAKRGQSGSPKISEELVLGNRLKQSVLSVRDLAKMQPGYTYIAHYAVDRGKERIYSFVDVVHMPIEFSTIAKRVYVPGIEPSPSKKSLAFAKTNTPIAANGSHRYMIAVTEADKGLSLKLGFHPGNEGVLYMTVYDADGAEVGFEWTSFSDQLASEKPLAEMQLPKLDPGIYEVTIAASSGRWMQESAYDLLIEAQRFGTETEKLELSSAKKTATVVFVNSAEQVGAIRAASVEGLSQALRFEDVKVKPNYWSYQPVVLPAKVTDGAAKSDLVVEIADAGEGFFGRLDHKLYELKDGEFKAIAEASTRGASRGAKTFKGVKLSETDAAARVVYFAVETYGLVPEAKGLSGVKDSIIVDAKFPQLKLASDAVKVSPEKLADNLFTVDVEWDGALPAATANKSKVIGSGVLRVSTDQSGYAAEIPVYLTK